MTKRAERSRCTRRTSTTPISCEHSITHRVVRTENDSRLTVLADRFKGKRLNAPNDVVVKSDDSIWFTDPLCHSLYVLYVEAHGAVQG